MLGLIIGNEDQESSSPTSGWRKSPTKAFYHDVIDLIERARNSRTNGQDDTHVCVDYFHKCFILALKKRGEPHIIGDKPIVWATTKARMIRHLGVARTFEIADLVVGPLQIEVQHQLMDSTPDTCGRFRFTTEQVTQMTTKSKNKKDDFLQRTLSPKASYNYMPILFFRIEMRSLVKFLQKEIRNKISHFKEGIQKTYVLEEKLTATGSTLKALFANDTAAFLWFQNTAKMLKKKTSTDTWLYCNLAKIGEEKGVINMNGTMSMVDQGTWDTMVNTNASTHQGEIVPLWNTCETATQQDEALLKPADTGWLEAVNFFVDDGIVSQKFIEKLLQIRYLWQETKLKFLLDEGDRDLGVLARLLYPYILKKAAGWTHNLWCSTIEIQEGAQEAFLQALFGA